MVAPLELLVSPKGKNKVWDLYGRRQPSSIQELSVPVKLWAIAKSYIYPTSPLPEFLSAFLVLDHLPFILLFLAHLLTQLLNSLCVRLWNLNQHMLSYF